MRTLHKNKKVPDTDIGYNMLTCALLFWPIIPNLELFGHVYVYVYKQLFFWPKIPKRDFAQICKQLFFGIELRKQLLNKNYIIEMLLPVMKI